MPSKVGTIDPMDKSRVYVDATLSPVSAGSAEAAFVYKKADLEAAQERRKELKLDKNDEAFRVQAESRKVEAAKAKRRAAAAQAEADALAASVAADSPKETKGSK